MTRSMLSRTFAVAWVAILAGSGCVRFHGPESIRRDLARASGVTLDREMGVTVTRSGMMLARWVNGMAGHPAEIPLEGIRRVEVGVYEVRGLRHGRDARQPLRAPTLPGWENVVRVREGDEEVFMLVREEDSEIRGLLVVVAEDDEWVLVRMRGRLNRVIENALELAFEEAARPDLFDPVVAEYRRGAGTAVGEDDPGEVEPSPRCPLAIPTVG